MFTSFYFEYSPYALTNEQPVLHKGVDAHLIMAFQMAKDGHNIKVTIVTVTMVEEQT